MNFPSKAENLENYKIPSNSNSVHVCLSLNLPLDDGVQDVILGIDGTLCSAEVDAKVPLQTLASKNVFANAGVTSRSQM